MFKGFLLLVSGNVFCLNKNSACHWWSGEKRVPDRRKLWAAKMTIGPTVCR